MIEAKTEGKIGMFFRNKNYQDAERSGSDKLSASLTEAKELIDSTEVLSSVNEDEEKRLARQHRLLRFSNHILFAEVAGGIAHEINNPLQYLLARLQLGRLQGCSADDFRKMEREAMRIAGLVKQFVVFSHQDEVKVPKPVLLNDLMNETIGLMQFQFRKRGITLEVSLDSSTPVIHSQPLILQQSLLSVLIDSRNRIAEGGELHIRTAFDARDGLRISLTDYGLLRVEKLRNRMSLSVEQLENSSGNDEAIFLATAYHLLSTIDSTLSIKSSIENGNVVTILVPAPAS